MGVSCDGRNLPAPGTAALASRDDAGCGGAVRASGATSAGKSRPSSSRVASMMSSSVCMSQLRSAPASGVHGAKTRAIMERSSSAYSRTDRDMSA
eukprot:scaffold113766_cov50-Phaeocystis_antarctica.AAC.1